MSGPPSPKRQRTDDKPAADDKPFAEPTPQEVEQIQKVLESVEKVEETLEKENEQQAKEILAVETKYNAKKRPTYEQRSKLLAKIPNFWRQVLFNHPLVGNCMDENDLKILEFLDALDVTFVDDNGGFKLDMSFKKNPFFSSASLWKQIKFSDDDELDVTASKIEWKDSEEANDVSGNSPFFEWFTATEGDQDIADIIKDDIWKNPVPFFMSVDEEDEDEEEGEDEDEDEDEDEKGGKEEEGGAKE